jgi:hypothetical protein
MKGLAFLIALLIVSQPLTALSQAHGHPAGGARPAAGGGGFNFNRDTAASRTTAPPRQMNNQASINRQNNRPNSNNFNHQNNNVNRNVNNTNVNRNVNNTNVNRNVSNYNRNVNVNNVTVNRGVVVANPVYHGPAYGWNHGAVWAPAPAYWGGGFWGALAIGATSAAIYGSIVANGQRYTSYQVQPSSPGATLLSNYHLTQTQCGPPNLVVIYGPNNGIICAYPNDLVSAGNYNVNASNLSLVSQ